MTFQERSTQNYLIKIFFNFKIVIFLSQTFHISNGIKITGHPNIQELTNFLSGSFFCLFNWMQPGIKIVCILVSPWRDIGPVLVNDMQMTPSKKGPIFFGPKCCVMF